MLKWPVHDSSGGPLAKRFHLETRIESHQGSRKSSGGVSAGTLTLGRR